MSPNGSTSRLAPRGHIRRSHSTFTGATPVLCDPCGLHDLRRLLGEGRRRGGELEQFTHATRAHELPIKTYMSMLLTHPLIDTIADMRASSQ